MRFIPPALGQEKNDNSLALLHKQFKVRGSTHLLRYHLFAMASTSNVACILLKRRDSTFIVVVILSPQADARHDGQCRYYSELDVRALLTLISRKGLLDITGSSVQIAFTTGGRVVASHRLCSNRLCNFLHDARKTWSSFRRRVVTATRRQRTVCDSRYTE